MSIRPDFQDMAANLGCAPNAAMRTIEIERSAFEELQAIAKREHCSVRNVVNEAINQWLGRV